MVRDQPTNRPTDIATYRSAIADKKEYRLPKPEVAAQRRKKKEKIYNPFLTNFRALYLTQFLLDLGQILDYKSYDQA